MALHPQLQPLAQQMQLPSPVRRHLLVPPGQGSQTLWVKHEEAIHPVVAGNKWRKLVPHLHQALAAGATGLATYGGAYSQHLLAVAWCARALGLPATGYLRGELPARPNPLLAQCRALGMHLLAQPRTGFATKALAAEGLDAEGTYHIPMGGASPASARYYGQSLWQELEPAIIAEGIEQIWISAGTGTSAAGLWLAACGRVPVFVVPAYKTNETFWAEMSRLTEGRLLPGNASFQLAEGLPPVRFGRTDAALEALAQSLQQQSGLRLEPVYEQRLFAMALTSPGPRRLVVHNGYP